MRKKVINVLVILTYLVILSALMTSMGKSMPKNIKCENGHILAVTKLSEKTYIISEDDYNTYCAPAKRQGGGT